MKLFIKPTADARKYRAATDAEILEAAAAILIKFGSTATIGHTIRGMSYLLMGQETDVVSRETKRLERQEKNL